MHPDHDPNGFTATGTCAAVASPDAAGSHPVLGVPTLAATRAHRWHKACLISPRAGEQETFAREVRLVEFTARHLWRFLRVIFRKHLSRRCRRCILSERHGPLNAAGLCAECEGFDTRPAPRINSTAASDEQHRDLDEILSSAAGRGCGNHDAIMLFSGGKDSTYLLHKLTRDYPRLRLLTVLVDTGFMSPFALRNARRVLRCFDVDHMTLCPRASFCKKVFRYAFTELPNQKGYSLVDQMDGHIIFDAANNLAARLRIPLVLSGPSRVQASLLFNQDGFEHPLPPAAPETYAGLPLRQLFSAEEMRNWFDGSRWPAGQRPRTA